MDMIARNETRSLPYWEEMCNWNRSAIYSTAIEKNVILKALRLAPEPSVALEIGCEGGRWSKLVADAGWNIICTEIDQHLLDICKERIPSATCILAELNDTTLSCETESIGLALCIEVPPVVHADWFMDETARVIEKGGLIVAVMWNSLSWRGLIHNSIAALRNNFDSFYPISYLRWRNKLTKKGFTILHEEGYCWSPFTRTSNSRFVPIAARIEQLLGLRKLVSFSPLVIVIARKE